MNPFTTALVKAPKRSRFDFSHSNTVGVRFGALTPTESRFIIPGDEVSVSLEQIARLAPMPVPTFVNLKVRHDWFFVPLRLLYPSEQLDQLFGANAGGVDRARFSELSLFYSAFSGYQFDDSIPAPAVGYYSNMPWGYPIPGSLFDFLGYPVLTDRNGGLDAAALTRIANNDIQGAMANLGSNIKSSMGNTPPVTFEKLVAYHYIWRDWYRFTGIESNAIVEPYLNNHVLAVGQTYVPSGSASTPGAAEPIRSFFDPNLVNESNSGDMRVGDLGRLKYAHLTKDMFTSARFGSKPTVLIPTGANGTIPALREASAIQRFIDILSITGQRYFDKVKGLFGVEPEGPKDDRVQFLARYQQFIKVGEVLTTADTADAKTGDYAGRGILIDGKYLFKRRFTEHGYLFCITSVIPDVAYNGLSRELTDINVFDTPVPTMAEVGDQTIFNREVNFIYGPVAGQPYVNRNNNSFGDQFRYYAYKSAYNEVHGYFLMEDARPWSPLLPNAYVIDSGGQTQSVIVPTDPINASRVYPIGWNYLFADTSDEFVFGDRFFFNIDFYVKITRALPKYINYHL